MEENKDNLHAHILLEVTEQGGSPLAAALLKKSWVTDIHIDDRRRVVEVVVQAADRDKLGEVTDDALTTATKMSADFRGILISNDGRARPGTWWLNEESRPLYKSEDSFLHTRLVVAEPAS